MSALTNLNVNELAAQAAAPLKALADFYSEYSKAAKIRGSYQATVLPPQISDRLAIALREAMVSFDPDPQGTIDELTRTDEPWGNGRVPESDTAFDWRTSRGVVA